MKILIVGDTDSTYHQWIKEQLIQPGYCTLPVRTTNLVEAKMMLRSIYFDAIVYCISDSSEKVKEKVSELKQAGMKTPFVILTDASHVPIAEVALKAGADTYVIKEAAHAKFMKECLDVLVSKKLDYLKRFSASGIFPQGTADGTNTTISYA